MKIFKKIKLSYILISTWVLLFLLVSMGFSAYTNNLGIESSAYMQSHIYDYVYITNMSIADSSNASSINYSFLDHEFKANVSAKTCNSYITYKIDIVNTTPHRAFITNTSVLSMINGNGNNTSSLDVEFIDVINNETSISPHETKSVYVKIKNNCSGSDESVIVKPSFEYSLFRYNNLVINATPSDANIELTTRDGTFNGTGTLTQGVMETDNITYTVTKDGYFPVEGTYTMTNSTHTIDVELDKIVNLTFDPNGGTLTDTTKAVAYNKPFGELPEPDNGNAVFLGWFDSKYQADALKYYADTYADLYNAFGYDDNSLYLHYLNNGKNENRRISEYLESDTVDFDTDKTLYAGWVYIWDKYDKKKAWNTTKIVTGDQARAGAGMYMNYYETAKLDEIIDVDSGNMIWNNGESFSILNRFPDKSTHVFPATADAIITHNNSATDTTKYYCIITNTRTTLWVTMTYDIYQISNVRWVKGDNFISKIYNCNKNTYPENNYKNDNWYVLN